MSLIQEGDQKKVRMAYLCIVSSHTVNGVAAIHSDLLIKTIFKEFYDFFPNKFQNKTNGVTPRRWIHSANRELSNLITETLGEEEWIGDLSLVNRLAPQIENKDFIKKWILVKHKNKERLAEWVRQNTGIEISTDALFDVQVKRIHEYKRQTMNVFYVIHKYLQIKNMSEEERKDVVPRVIMIGGKAAPGYYNAKQLIKLINNVGFKINDDPETGDLLKLIFLPNYNVSSAQIIIPATEISQHISTAGTEASGTSNMKFVMNGGLIIGTMDGANVEIAEEIGEENMFIFGGKVNDINEWRADMHQSGGDTSYVPNEIKTVLHEIRNKTFGDMSSMNDFLTSVDGGYDHYCVCQDFVSYIKAQEKVDEAYKNPLRWNQMSIKGVAHSYKFSSDRTIQEYCDDIWNVERIEIPKPSLNPMQRVRSFPNLTTNDSSDRTTNV